MNLRFCSLLSVAVLTIGISTASADPITVTGGYIQVGTEATDFFITTAGLGFAGEREIGGSSGVMFSGLPGNTVDLSTTFAQDLTNARLIPGDDFFARVAFTFDSGTITVPTYEDSLQGDGWVYAPFTFTGTISGYESSEARANGGTPAFTYDLIGRGTARALFTVQRTNTGEPLLTQPLVASSVVHEFAAVPEPGTFVLVASCLAAAYGLRRGWRSDGTRPRARKNQGA